MNATQVILVLLLGIIHWLLALILIEDVIEKSKHKKFWGILIVTVSLIGSVIYIVTHPRLFTEKD